MGANPPSDAMHSLHFIDYAIVVAYFALLLVLGKIASKDATTGEGFFLAGRKLGKFYQFFLNFGNSVAAGDAVSTASLVYRQGISGVWLGFQMIFLNPYYWLTIPWYRRVRLTTTAELFEDRLNSRRLAVLYATFQIIMAVAVSMAFGNLVSYKISAALVSKAETAWTPVEAASVAGYRELGQLETLSVQPTFTPQERDRLGLLREKQARGELTNHITGLNPWLFYILYTIAVGTYIVMGGMAATAMTESVQGVLILVFSVILIPTGLHAIGGWDALGQKLNPEALKLFGSATASDFTGWTIAAIFLATMMQTNAGPEKMSLGGSARNEYAARFGTVAGTFGKRLVTITWAFCGLIAIVLFSGAETVADADLVWGTMSRQLLGPGLLGLMFAGALAANMSTVATHAMAVSALFARSIYTLFRPHATDRDIVGAARWTLVGVLVLGVLVATQMSNVYTVLQFAMTINVPFGASILLMFIWRRVTAAAVWTAVLGSAFINIAFPLIAPNLPVLSGNSALVTRATDISGRPVPVYFETVIRTRPEDPTSALQGRGRLHTELVLLRGLGINVPNLSSGGRLAGRFFVDALLPVFLILAVSLITRRPPKAQVDLFFGKMKTPVAETPEQDEIEMALTHAAPHRFDHLKLWPSSTWEFSRWTKVDTIGFIASCGVTLAILGLFIGLLKLVAP